MRQCVLYHKIDDYEAHFPKGGTGSYPFAPNGWHRKIRQTPSNRPLAAPCTRKASIMYAEQLGVKRQHPPINGLSTT